MILVLVFIGFLVGGSAAVLALSGGAGFLTALIAYSFFGSTALVFTSALIALAPIWRAHPPRSGGQYEPYRAPIPPLPHDYPV